MLNAVQLLTQAIQEAARSSQEYRWQDLRAAMEQVVSKPSTRETEILLLTLLRFEGRIRLSSESEFPHSMSAEEMLKSFAIQALGKWGGPRYLADIERVGDTAESPILSTIVRRVVQKIKQSEKHLTSVEQSSVRRSVDGLKRVRQIAGLSLDEISRWSGIPEDKLRRLEAGQYVEAPLAVLLRYAEALGQTWELSLEDIGVTAKRSVRVIAPFSAQVQAYNPVPAVRSEGGMTFLADQRGRRKKTKESEELPCSTAAS